MFFFQAEDGIRDLVRSRGLGDVYKRQILFQPENAADLAQALRTVRQLDQATAQAACLTYAQALAWPVVAQMHLAAYQKARRGAPC